MGVGAKYDPLFEYLLFSGQGSLRLSFREIERIIATRLPASARQRQEWWSNSENGHSQARAWMRANYRTSKVDLASESIVFTLEGWPGNYQPAGGDRLVAQASRGLNENRQVPYESETAQGTAEAREQHPLIGIWTGKATLVPGYDYTKPAYDGD
ncbi:MAG TPA: hypothetical protein VLQ68_04480 [Rhizobiaceae bacterium]|nr:hypothetical protein [Rhizobiaceae bacterium]